MTDASAHIEGSLTSQPSSPQKSRFERFKDFLRQFRKEAKSSQVLPQKETPKSLTTDELKKMSNIPTNSGYEQLIDSSQDGKPDNVPDPMANELARLYPDFLVFINDPASGISPSDRENALQRLNQGDKNFIVEMASKLRDRYLGNQNFQNVSERLNKGKSNEPLDLKIVLANQLSDQMKKSIAQDSNRAAEVRWIKADLGSPSTASPPVSAKVIRQINNPGGPK